MTLSADKKRKIAILVGGGSLLGAILMAYYYPDNPEGPEESVPVLRAQALGLCGLYLPCRRDDAHYKEICKNFGGKGTTCGFLIGWLLYRLGCRDNRIVNRSEPAAGLVYHEAGNMTAVVSGGKAVGAYRNFRTGDAPPEGGDILYFQATDFIAGQSDQPHEHVAVCVDYDMAKGTLTTYDLGHSSQPEGALTVRTMHPNGDIDFLGSTRRIVGIDSLALIPMTAAPDLTDHTIGVA